jgi:hypothetical protein
MLRQKFLIAAILILVPLSCRVNPLIPAEIELFPKQLSKIITDNENYDLFLYSGEKLVKYETVRNNLTTVTVLFRYREDGTLESEEAVQKGNINDRRLYTYIYDDTGRISRIDVSMFEAGSFKSSGSFTCYYNQVNQLVRTVYLPVGQSSPQVTDYSYYAGGNTREKIRYTEGRLYDRITYEYDDNRNPSNIINSKTFCGMLVNNNNVTATTVESYFESRSYQLVITYTYGDDGYPMKRVIRKTDDENNSSQLTEEYIYN